MALLSSEPLQPDFIKLRWLEPYTSAGLNRKTFKSLPRGVYSGFIVRPGPGLFEVTVKHDDPEGFGEVSGFSEGNFDPASSGWSVAVHASMQGFTSTVAILAAAGGANDFTFDLASYQGDTVFLALHVDYQIGVSTSGDIRVVQAQDLDDDPALINLARIDVPMSVSGIAQENIINDDPAYPRVLPFANKFKYGFMSKFQAALLEDVQNISGTPAFVHEHVVDVDGQPQTISLPPGAFYTVGGDDLWVFKDRGLLRVGRDYDEVDRGDGFGEEISVKATLRAGDIILLRIQKFSSVLTSRMSVFDTNALISSNVIGMNFDGTGVFVTPDGPNRVKVTIPGGGGASAVAQKTNSTGATIPAYHAVHLLSDNTIEPFDPTVSSQTFFGITLQDIAPSVAGDVQVAGIVPMGALGVSGTSPTIGDDIFVDHDGLGTLTVDPPDPVSGQIVRVGQLEGPDTAVTGAAENIVFDRGRIS